MAVAVENELEPTTVSILEGATATEVIADQIERIADAAEQLLSTGLNERAIVLLIKDKADGRVRLAEIEAVLAALPALREYLD